jgi:recombination protein RecR
MQRAEYPEEIQNLIQQLKRLPGVGPRSAERLALHLLSTRTQHPLDLAQALMAAIQGVGPCSRCGFYRGVRALCAVCDAVGRDESVLCVVEQPADVLPLERTKGFNGRYHVLGGRLSPLSGVQPEHLRLALLTERVRAGGVSEVILALSADVEGEATAHFIAQSLAAEPVTVTRLAQGLPAGGGLEQADELTLFRALAGRCAVR